jgi:uncharacterized protein (DUF2147 family)
MKMSSTFVTRSLKTMTLAALALGASSVFAAGESPVGRWQTIDDETGKPKSIVEIKEVNGELQGSVVELINPSKPNPTCEKCEGDRKDKPIQGMTILWGVKKDGDSWGDGKILDPQKGKVYGAKLEPEAGGQKLKVRGYLGVSALGRTQEWVRAQ